jgi:hypothetical protein
MKKTVTKRHKQVEADSAHQSVERAENQSLPMSADTGDLAQLVWKYFSEEITQALAEVQELGFPMVAQHSTALKLGGNCSAKTHRLSD